MFDNIRVLYNDQKDFLEIGTPVDVLTISNSSLRNSRINFYGNKAMTDYLNTTINIYGCVFNSKGVMNLLNNNIDGKKIVLKTSSNISLNDDFLATVTAGKGNVKIESDLPGLRK